MQPFEYANPASVQEAVALLSPRWGQADVLAGGTDLISCMKEHLHTPKRVVNIKNIKELSGIQKTGGGAPDRGSGHDRRAGHECRGQGRIQIAGRGRRRRSQSADPAHGNGGRRPVPASALLVLPQRHGPAGHERRQVACARGREPVSRDLWDGAGILRERFQPGAGAGGVERQGEAGRSQGRARGARGGVLCGAERRSVARNRSAAERDSHRDSGAGLA